jgi:Zn-dependent protease with chaperone function
MSTNFFEHQDTARRNTSRLVLLFLFSVLCIAGITYFLFWGLYVYDHLDEKLPMPSFWQPILLAVVLGGVSLVIGCGSLYKIAELSSGGKAVALMVGGQEIQPNTRDPRQRRILNVVEEMSIASGVPVPPVYLLPDESGINAFAAGHAPGDAVVAVSQGCLDYLTRDELQGVIGHEFSHVLNGDMRLNIRLMGLNHGLLVLSLIGYYLMDAASRSSRSSSNNKDKGRNQLFLVGLGMYILGALGAFFGVLIQAAISRQREYLADASSIQFTRNPEGIGGALKKIGGLEQGSAIDNPGKVEVAHMFFADGFKSRFFNLLASHPPLADRIRQIDPNWDGKYPHVKKIDVDTEERRDPPKRKIIPNMPTIPGVPQVPIPVLGLAGNSAPPPSEVDVVIPEVLREASREPFSARALIYALLLDRDPRIRDKQLAHLQAEGDPKDVKETLRLQNPALELGEAARLPLVDLSMPALRQMSPKQYQVFRGQMQFFIEADQQLSLFEYTLSSVLTSYLDQAYQLGSPPANRYRAASALIAPVTKVISKVAWAGVDNERTIQAAFQAGMRQFITEGDIPEILPRNDVSLNEFDRALKMIRDSVLPIKRRVVNACWACITADGTVTLRQSELLRAICAVLGTPMPA